MLAFRVTTLEENVGNSSVAELELRLKTVKGIVADHEIKISASEVNVKGKFLHVNLKIEHWY